MNLIKRDAPHQTGGTLRMIASSRPVRARRTKDASKPRALPWADLAGAFSVGERTSQAQLHETLAAFPNYVAPFMFLFVLK
jgi:hypothetical protein